ncbi:MAG: DinB family protein [bacterium]
MTKTYRTGGLGAMQDEYERATVDLLSILEMMPDEVYEKIYTNERESINSIQKMMLHIIGAGYGYANKIRKTIGVDVSTERPKELMSRLDSISGLKKLLSYSSDTFEGKWSMSDDELDATKMMSPWKVEYSIEQMMEHAIVHILRHRRQIERVMERS